MPEFLYTERPEITEAEAERMADARVMQRLATDLQYKHAASPEDQAEREQEIAEDVWAALELKYRIR